MKLYSPSLVGCAPAVGCESMHCVLMFCPGTSAWTVAAPLAIYDNVACVWKVAAGKDAKTSLAMLRGGMFVFSCCVMGYKCGCLKERAVVWVERLSAPHSFRPLAQVWPGHTTEAYMSSGYIEAPSGCWQN